MSGNHFEHKHRRAGSLQGERVGAQAVGGILLTALDPITSECRHGLWRKPKMSADGDTPLDKECNYFRRPPATLELTIWAPACISSIADAIACSRDC